MNDKVRTIAEFAEGREGDALILLEIARTAMKMGFINDICDELDLSEDYMRWLQRDLEIFLDEPDTQSPVDWVAGIDMELLKEQADATTTIPDKDYSEGTGSLLSWIILAIETHGYVVIYDASMPFGDMPANLQAMVLTNLSNEAVNK